MTKAFAVLLALIAGLLAGCASQGTSGWVGTAASPAMELADPFYNSRHAQ